MPLSSAFLKDVLDRIPEADRGTVLAVLEKPEAADAIKYIEDGAKRQSEFSRSMDEGRRALAAKEQELQDAAAAIQATADRQTAWYEANKAALDAGWKALKDGGTGDPAAAPAAPTNALPPDVLRRADAEKIITEREQGAARYMHAVIPLALKHFQEFGEVLDFEALVANPRIREVGLLGVYDAQVADRRRAAAAKAEEARVEARVQERLAAERKRGIVAPYPVSPMDVSPLDALRPADAKPGLVDDATDLYQQLVQDRLARDARPAGSP